MKLLLLLCFSLSVLFSDVTYPELFSQLGTPLYKADKKFAHLPKNEVYSFDVNTFHKNQKKALNLYEIGNKPAYFKALRALSKEYDNIITVLKKELSLAIKDNDYNYFIELSNVGIDTLYQQESFKKLNYNYYLSHKNQQVSPYLDKRIKAEKGYEHLYGVDISSNSYASLTQHPHAKKVILLSRPGCGFCVKAKTFMKSQGIRYTEYNILTSSKGISLFKKNQGTGVPLILIGDEVIRGYSKSSIMNAL